MVVTFSESALSVEHRDIQLGIIDEFKECIQSAGDLSEASDADLMQSLRIMFPSDRLFSNEVRLCPEIYKYIKLTLRERGIEGRRGQSSAYTLTHLLTHYTKRKTYQKP